MKTGHHEYHISKHNIYVFLLINILCERNIVTEINCSLFHFWLSFKGCLIREHYCSVVKVVSDSLQPHELQYTRLPCHSLCLWVCSNSCPLSQWGHPTISSSVTPVSFCPQSSPASESFPMSWLFTSDGQSIGASASVLPMNIQGWFPCCSRVSVESSPAPQWESINSLALSLLYGPTLTSTDDYWKKHSFDCTDLCR